MANTVLTADIIASEALAILDNDLGFLDTIHRAYEDEFDKTVNGYAIGETISIARPYDPVVRVGATASTQDVIEGKVALTVDQQIGQDFKFTSRQLTMSVTQISDRVIQPAITAIRNYIGNYVLSGMYQNCYDWVGTPGQSINAFSDFLVPCQRLDEKGVPGDNRSCVLSPTDFYAMAGAQAGLYIQSAASEAYRDGELGRLSGVKTMMSQVVPSHTVGPLGGTPLVNGASQNVTYDTAKNTWTQTLVTDGWTAAAASRLKAGDVFTLYVSGTSGPRIKMVNPKTKQATTVDQQFVVLSDVSSDASGNATLTISPPIISTSGAYQTVNAAPADNAGLTVLGTASTAYSQNLFYHKNAYALAVVPMEIPAGVTGAARKTAKGLSVRVIPYYDGTNDVSSWRLDVLFGGKAIDPRMMTRASGT